MSESEVLHEQSVTEKPRQPRNRTVTRWILLTVAMALAGGIGMSWWSTGSPLGFVDWFAMEEPSAPHATHEEKSQQALVTSEMAGVMVSSRKQQLIGVKTEIAAVRSLTHSIRTFGLVEVNETKLTHIHTKMDGWIQKLYVKFSGERVEKDQMLFEIYSPELVSTQEEYLLALKAVRTLGNSEFPGIAENARSLLRATRQRFALWDITPDHIEDLKRTGAVLRTLPLHAPSSGHILSMHVREGMHVTPAMELYTLADLSTVWVLADLYEYEIPLVQLGQQAKITMPYLPGKTLTGTVTYIYPVLDTKTRTVKVRFELPNPGWTLKPGMFANVELTISLGDRLVIPTTAVLDSGTEQLVFVDQGNGMFEPRTVTVGVRTRDWCEVKEGVQAGERVVTSGNFLIDSESNLKASAGMMHSSHGMENQAPHD